MTNQIILPGELIDDRKGRKIGNGVYLEGEKVFANNDDKIVSQDEIDAYIEAQAKED